MYSDSAKTKVVGARIIPFLGTSGHATENTTMIAASVLQAREHDVQLCLKEKMNKENGLLMNTRKTLGQNTQKYFG